MLKKESSESSKAPSCALGGAKEQVFFFLPATMERPEGSNPDEASGGFATVGISGAQSSWHHAPSPRGLSPSLRDGQTRPMEANSPRGWRKDSDDRRRNPSAAAGLAGTTHHLRG